MREILGVNLQGSENLDPRFCCPVKEMVGEKGLSSGTGIIIYPRRDNTGLTEGKFLGIGASAQPDNLCFLAKVDGKKVSLGEGTRISIGFLTPEETDDF